MRMKVFASRLLELRTDRKLSQARLAKEIGVSNGIVCLWETNKSEPTAPNIVAVAAFFDVSTDYLLGRENYDGSKPA
jgi:transcriptional regulator with XRE-family HTH domain